MYSFIAGLSRVTVDLVSLERRSVLFWVTGDGSRIVGFSRWSGLVQCERLLMSDKRWVICTTRSGLFTPPPKSFGIMR